LLLDFPGFGGAPPPPVPWGTIEYSDLVAEWLDQLPRKPRVWIGHSFGCRIGIRLASRHPKQLDGLVLIAGAGIRPPVPLHKRISRTLRGWMFKILKAIATSEDAKNRLRERWGSADYRRAGELRSTFVKVVNEDLSTDAAQVDVPVCLIYGERDTETPPSVGKAFASRIKKSSLHLLPRYGHLDILNEGRFQVQALIKDFVKGIFK
jgi:pimeloyl-ACP methyl ester carboxylesterase